MKTLDVRWPVTLPHTFHVHNEMIKCGYNCKNIVFLLCSKETRLVTNRLKFTLFCYCKTTTCHLKRRKYLMAESPICPAASIIHLHLHPCSVCRKEWASLGNLEKEEAMVEFVKLLNKCCNLFAPYVTSHKIEREEQERKR